MTEQIKDREDYLHRLHNALLFIVDHLESRRTEGDVFPHYEIHLNREETEELMQIVNIIPTTPEETNANN